MHRYLLPLALAFVILSSCRFFAPPAPAPPEPVFTRVAEEALPPALREWADNSRTMHIAHSKVYQNKRYILAGYGEKPTGGYSIAIEDVVIGESKITVTVNYADPPPGSNVTDALTYPQDIVYIANLDLPIEYEGTGAQEYVPTLVGIEELPEITAQSPFIKIFEPSPDTRVPPSFTVKGVANVFEGAISCRLRDAQGNFSQEVLATAGMGDWYYFQVDMEVPEEFADFHLELFTYSAKDGSIENLVQIPLEREEAGD